MKPRAHKLQQHLQQLLTPLIALAHDQVWQEILDHLQPLDFAAEANVGVGKTPTQADYVVVTVRAVLQIAQTIQCGLCKRFDFVYAFNGAYWREITKDALSQFLGAAAVKLGVPAIKAEHWHFRESLLKQFFSTAYLPEPFRKDDVTLINFRNGTLEISSAGWHLRPFDRHDFLTYQLPFDFDCNELPRDVEHSEAYFRRFLVIPFTVTIPEAERYVDLAHAIIRAELSGVFNWVLAGLRRLLTQKNFSPSDAAKIALADYRRESDSVLLFLEEEDYTSSLEAWVLLKTLYAEYRSYCLEAGFKPLGRGKFAARLRANQLVMEKERTGFVVYVSRA